VRLSVLAVALLVSVSVRAARDWQSASPWETDPDRLCASLMIRNQQGELVRPDELEACEAEAAARLERRRAAAPSLTREELAQIPAELRITEELQRLAVLDAQRARAERAARLRDIRWMRPALSAAWCTYANMRSEALAKRSDPSERQRASDYLRSMNTIAIALRAFSAKPTACTDPLTAKIVGCLEPRSGCSAEILEYAALAPKIYP
jgi:hypothetical protein